MRVGVLPVDRTASRGPRRLPSLEPAPASHRPWTRIARRTAFAAAAVGAGLGTFYALERIGLDSIARTLLASSPTWVLVALALMCVSMLARAVAWHAILKAALPAALPRFADALQGTNIGVLMSATLPARLGEPSRALIVARRLGRPRESLPAVLGTIVSQSLLNILALVILGAVMFATIGLFAGRQQALVWYALAPIAALVAVLVLPALLRSGLPSRSARVAKWMSEGRSRADPRALRARGVPPPAPGRRGRRHAARRRGRSSG